MRFAQAFALVLLLVARVVVAAEPGDPHALLRKGIELQREASWSASITALERARSMGTLASAERAECAFYLGAAYLAIGSEAAARRELGTVLDMEPGFEPPRYTSPKVASLLGEVARSRSSAAQLDPRPPRQLGKADEPLRLELSFEAHRVHAPVYGVVRFRMRGDKTFSNAPLTARPSTTDGTLSLVAEVDPTHGGVLEYYADALEPTGRLVAGSAEKPFELPVAEPARRIAAKPTRPPSKLVWLAIPAGVVLGAAVGLGLYFGLRH